MQAWAKRRGGAEAALARPEVPRGGPLREAIAAALRSNIKHNQAAEDLLGFDFYVDGQVRWEPSMLGGEEGKRQQQAPLAAPLDGPQEQGNVHEGHA